MDGWLPAIVLRNIKYSKLEISRRCQRCVMLEFRISWRGDIIDARLQHKSHTSFQLFYFTLGMGKGRKPTQIVESLFKCGADIWKGFIAEGLGLKLCGFCNLKGTFSLGCNSNRIFTSQKIQNPQHFINNLYFFTFAYFFEIRGYRADLHRFVGRFRSFTTFKWFHTITMVSFFSFQEFVFLGTHLPL